MPHIHTGPGEHDATASAFLIRRDTPQPQVLLHMHKKLGKLIQPGGHVELTENPWQAVLHEVTEETGYNLDQLKVLQPEARLKQLSGATLHPLPFCDNTHNFYPDGSHKHSDRAYAFVVDGVPQQSPASGESTQLEWYDHAALANLSSEQIPESVRELAQYVLTNIVGTWEEVSLEDFAA